MSFLLLFLCGILGGVLGGMGLGGGTALIPLLTIVCGLEQSAAQGINLIAFLPMACLALSVHAGNRLLALKSLKWLVPPAIVFSALASLAAAHLPSDALRTGFGVFLIVLSIFWFKNAFQTRRSGQKS